MSCLATLIQNFLPEKRRLTKYDDLGSILLQTGIVSEAVLSHLAQDLPSYFRAGKIFCLVVAEYGAGALIYLPRLTRSM